MENFVSIIKKLKADIKRQPLAYFGAGGMGKSFINFSQELGFSPDFMIDSDKKKHGTEFCGIPVLSPDKAMAMCANIVITNGYYHQIRPQLQGYKDGRVLHSKAAALIMSSNSCEMYEKFADDISKETLLSLFKYYVGDNELPSKSKYVQYILPSLNFKNIKSIVDAGAFDGGSYSKFRKLCGNEVVIHSFEPIPENYEKLKNKLQTNDRANIRNVGLWSKKTSLPFDLNSAASRVITDNSSGHELPVVPLDDFSLVVDYIKMDIEGAETNALIGAMDTIKRCQPNLAISIYHSFQDFIELPHMIMQLLPDHVFFLGHHYSENQGEIFYDYETVFYAIRKSDII